jgi:putative cell wall-binding protein
VTATKRFTGADRFATANAVANYGAVTNQGKFVLVNGNSFADGLAASALAGALGGALLLTEKDATPNSVLTTMNSMSSAVAGANKYVFLVGGTSVISEAQATTLTASGWTVTRVSGATRYATADAVAAMVKTQNGGASGSLGGYKTAFLANGNSFADALSVSSMAYDNKLPIFLTDGTTLSTNTAAQIKASGIQKVFVLGGTTAVSTAVATAADGVSTVAVVQRLSGADRYETSKAIADALGLLDATRKVKAVIVDGNNFPDGLAASQYAASIDASILLVNGSTLPTSISTWLTSRQSTLTDIAAVGGTTAVPAAAVTAAKAAATTAAITATFSKAVDGGTTYTVTFSGQVSEATAETAGNHVHTFKSGGTENAAGVVYTYSATTGVSKAVVTQTTALKPGDSLTVVGGAIQDINHALTGVTVAMASTTVTTLSGAPTATIYAEAAAANAAKAVYVTFNMAIKDATFAAAGDVIVTDAVVGGTAAVLDTCAKITGFTWSCDVAPGGEALSTGDTVTLGAGKVTSNATVAVNNIAASTVTISDVTAPVLSSATYSALTASTLQANQASMRVIGDTADATGASGNFNVDATKGDVIVAVKAGSALAGRAGNAVKMVVDVTGAADTGCSYASATKIVTIKVQAVTTLAPAVTDAINASATCKDLFVATTVKVGADYAMTAAADTTTGSIAMTGGLDQFDVTLTFSEPIGAGHDETNLQFTVNNTAVDVADTSVAVKVSSVVELQQELNGVMIYTITTAHPVSTGLDKVTVDEAGVVDRAGNALAINGVSNVVPMYLG